MMIGDRLVTEPRAGSAYAAPVESATAQAASTAVAGELAARVDAAKSAVLAESERLGAAYGPALAALRPVDAARAGLADSLAGRREGLRRDQELRSLSHLRSTSVWDSFRPSLPPDLFGPDAPLQVFTPPYVMSATSSVASANPARGTMTASAISAEDTGTASGASLGLFLSVEASTIVRVSPYMPILADWGSVVWDGVLTRVWGTAGVLVRELGGPTLADAAVTLFDDLRLGLGSAEGHDDAYLGSTPAGHLYVPMRVGRVYQVSFYILAGAVADGPLTLASASLSARIPFVVTEDKL